MFRTKPQIGLELIERALANGVRASGQTSRAIVATSARVPGRKPFIEIAVSKIRLPIRTRPSIEIHRCIPLVRPIQREIKARAAAIVPLPVVSSILGGLYSALDDPPMDQLRIDDEMPGQFDDRVPAIGSTGRAAATMTMHGGDARDTQPDQGEHRARWLRHGVGAQGQIIHREVFRCVDAELTDVGRGVVEGKPLRPGE